ncbi:MULTISPECIES: rhomboid family intramembrane serine protease [Cytobacillus]|uniref:Rhomboid family intramembrane serine protease n=1 Tax=Cytobacillus stercorigallinarum TaxID=2762240 RepID=A0ABR8QK58_9BACI|nr:rhomboid family intramembrane serine protease [Cytobacillus stercorigallinarum]MBD7935862.1 rhomboid family intramembrane serine protease [Cytobacillus stercorigallinarum]
MNSKEAYLFWSLAYHLLHQEEYRFIQLSEKQDELWIEKLENKQTKVIRLLRKNLDWSNWLQRDIEAVAFNGERIRKQVRHKEMTVLNVYISPFVPVDDYEDKLNKPFKHSKMEKTTVESVIMTVDRLDEVVKQLHPYFEKPLFSLEATSDDEIDEQVIENLKNQTLRFAANKAKEEKEVFSQGKPIFTYLFIALQVLAFFWLEWKGGSTNTSVLIESGAKYNPLILAGEWWRFFTPIILHIGFLHLLMNTLALFYLGSAVERIMGNTRFIFIYLLSGFMGSLLSFITSPNVSAGASGAIFGCFGALLFFGIMKPKLFFRTMGMNIIIVLVFNLALGFMIPGIDNAGHIGGLIGGFLATGIVLLPKKRKRVVQLLIACFTALLISGGLYYGYHNPNDQTQEEMALIEAQNHLEKENYSMMIQELTPFDKEGATAQTYFLLSYAEIQLGEIEEAKRHLHLAIEENEQFHEAYYNLSLLYLREGQMDEAKKYLDQAVELHDSEDYRKLQDNLNESK